MVKTDKIPKILHSVWFGNGKKNKIILKCEKSWKKYCPDFKHYEWNEKNFDISTTPKYVQDAYKNKKWAFISDYVRLWALNKYGGIYVDTDIEIIKPIYKLLEIQNEGFSGFSTMDRIPAAMVGSKKNCNHIKFLLSYYDNKSFIKKNGDLDLTSNTIIITNLVCNKFKNFKMNNKKQIVDNFIYFPYDYFNPEMFSKYNKVNITKNTYCIHWHNESWYSINKKFFVFIIGMFEKVGLGIILVNFLKKNKLYEKTKKKLKL